MTLGCVYLVATPRPSQAEDEFLARVGAALAGGVDVLQLRVKQLEALPLLKLASKIHTMAHDSGVPFIVNDRPDVALAVGADGVHLGQRDLPIEWARKIVPGAIIGRSSHESAHADAALAEGADYFAVGPVWATPTKPGRTPTGLTYVRDVAARRIDRPWYAIGGITLDNVSEVIAAGASRIAVVRAILDAPDPAEAAHGFVVALGAARWK
jgi:thiamine-phosphate pyrophosphorylase